MGYRSWNYQSIKFEWSQCLKYCRSCAYGIFYILCIFKINSQKIVLRYQYRSIYLVCTLYDIFYNPTTYQFVKPLHQNRQHFFGVPLPPKCMCFFPFIWGTTGYQVPQRKRIHKIKVHKIRESEHAKWVKKITSVIKKKYNNLRLLQFQNLSIWDHYKILKHCRVFISVSHTWTPDSLDLRNIHTICSFQNDCCRLSFSKNV